jgi:hypothetical protein
MATRIPCVFNITPFPRTVTADNNIIFIAPLRAVNRVRDAEGNSHAYQMFDFEGQGYKDSKLGKMEPRPQLEMGIIPESRLRMIASNNNGLLYVENSLDIRSGLVAEVQKRVNEVKALVNSYIKGRQEAIAHKSYILPEEQDVNPRTGKPYLPGYEEEIAHLQGLAAKWATEGFPKMRDILDKDDSPELQAEAKEAEHALQTAALKGENEALSAQMREAMAELRATREEIEELRKMKLPDAPSNGDKVDGRKTEAYRQAASDRAKRRIGPDGKFLKKTEKAGVNI